MNVCKALEISDDIAALFDRAEAALASRFRDIEQNEEICQCRILHAMQAHKIAQRHFAPTTGYGYGDAGREALDQVYADVFGGEKALVRLTWVSGSHVLSDALFALLRPGDILLSATGKPYDTLGGIIGYGDEKNNASLHAWGIHYKQIELNQDDGIDLKSILSAIEQEPRIKVVFMQRSRGYAWRRALSMDELSEAIQVIKTAAPWVNILVDNCYGEFVTDREPGHLGADLTVGSLIKNPGGGLCPCGAYAVGTGYAIDRLAQRMTAPGIGSEVGAAPYGHRELFMGLFLAPHVVAQSLKVAVLAAHVFDAMGYAVSPEATDARSDIIQAVRFADAKSLIAFCQQIQCMSPVDSHVTPQPWDMPGYPHQVIMAAGTFIEGASIELSADAPIREPYTAYLQGGLTYAHGKMALMRTADRIASGE
jgi:cystathionine beta-lyase family protein involved in aluminum resistance